MGHGRGAAAQHVRCGQLGQNECGQCLARTVGAEQQIALAAQLVVLIDVAAIAWSTAATCDVKWAIVASASAPTAASPPRRFFQLSRQT
jgi:hypothetical protein